MIGALAPEAQSGIHALLHLRRCEVRHLRQRTRLVGRAMASATTAIAAATPTAMLNRCEDLLESTSW